MSNWNQKSVANMDAATYLLDNNLYNESVHCSYYSCVQYVFHVMYSFWNMQVSEIDHQSKSQVNGVGTHVWLRNEIFKSMYQQNKEDANLFNTKMGELVKVRVKADYKYKIVSDEEARQVQEDATSVLDLLKNVYDI